MTPAVFTEDVVKFLIHSGWRQFLLDGQFNVLPPCPALAELSKLAPQTVENRPFATLFDSADQKKLRALLSQLDAEPDQTISTTLRLQGVAKSPEIVECMLYPAQKKNPRASYTGFVRPLPNPSQETTAQKLSQTDTNLSAIAQFGHRLAVVSDLDTLLYDVTRILSQDFGYEYISIFLTDPEETMLTLKNISNVNLDSIPANCISIPISNQTIIGHGANMAKSILVNNTSDSDYHPLDYLPVQTLSELAVPLFTGNQVLGILDAQSPQPTQYDANDLLLLETFASQVAMAIANIRLHEERDRHIAELIAFNEIGLVITELGELQAIFLNIVQRITVLFQVEAVSLLLLDGDNLRFVAATGAGAEERKPFILKPGQGIAWSVIKTGQTIRVDKVDTDSRHFSSIDAAPQFTTHSILAVPVQVHDRILGVIEAINRLDGRPFSQEDEIALEFIVSSVAIAIENARLFGQIQRHVARVEGLLEASHTLNTLDLQDILDTIVQRVSALLKADLTVVYLPDYQSRKIRATAVHSIGDWVNVPTPAFSFDEGTVGWVFEHQQPLRINDVTKDDRFVQISSRSHLITNLLSIPLTVKGETIGVIEAAHRTDGEDYTEEDEALLSAFASQAAVAIHNARLFQETDQRLAEVSTLYTLAEQLTRALELDRIVESSVTILKHALDCSGCCLFLRQIDDTGSFILKACSGWPKAEHASPELDYLTKLTKSLLTKPYPIYVRDVQETLSTDGLEPSEAIQPQEMADLAQIQLGSVMIIPLIVQAELLGALSISDLRPNAFEQADGRLLTIAAAQISTAIQNSRLYDNVEQRAVELEAALQEVEATNRLKSEFVENVSHELRTPLTFIKAYVALILEDDQKDVSPGIRDKLRIIAQKTETIIRLVEDLVSLQKIEAGNLRLEAITAHQLITQVTSGASASATEHNIKIVVNSAPDLPKVLVDVDRMGQVFDNLVGNALKFSPAGSKIKITAEQDGESIKFSVQDYGIGIPADKLDRIFERFYQINSRARQKYHGAGLGLTIVKQIVEAHNGRIIVESEVDRGTIFSFWLPIYQEP